MIAAADVRPQAQRCTRLCPLFLTEAGMTAIRPVAYRGDVLADARLIEVVRTFFGTVYHNIGPSKPG